MGKACRSGPHATHPPGNPECHDQGGPKGPHTPTSHHLRLVTGSLALSIKSRSYRDKYRRVSNESSLRTDHAYAYSQKFSLIHRSYSDPESKSRRQISTKFPSRQRILCIFCRPRTLWDQYQSTSRAGGICAQRLLSVSRVPCPTTPTTQTQHPPP